MNRSRGSRIVISTETCRRRNRRWWRALGSRSGRAGAWIVGRRRSGGRPMAERRRLPDGYLSPI